ncbi:hypothetical protein GCM10028824_00110 [Hymenobacter segetis]
MVLGNFTLTSAGSYDLFVGRLNAAGQWTQAARAGGLTFDDATGIALGPDGSVTVTGTFTSPTVAFGTTILTNSSMAASSSLLLRDLFVARLSPAGQWVMAVQAVGVHGDYAVAVALDANGDAVVAGEFYGATLAFGPFTLSNFRAPVGDFDFPFQVFVARVNSNGQWTQAVKAGSSTGTTRARAMTLDATGTATIGGFFTGPAVAFGSLPPIINAGSNDGFVARLNRAGQWTYAAQIGGTNDDYVLSLATNDVGDVAVGGYYYSTAMSVGTQSLTNSSSGFSNGFVLRLSQANAWTQAAAVAGPASKRVTGVALDTDGTAVAVGFFIGANAVFGTNPPLVGNTTIVASPADLFIARLTPGIGWTQVAGAPSPYSDFPNAVALDRNGGAIVAGQYAGSAPAFGSMPALPAVSTTGLAGFVARWGTNTASATTRSSRFHALTLAPNPARAQVHLFLPESAASTKAILLDNLGRPVRAYILPAHATTATLDLAGLAPGLYVVRCGTASGRLVVE